MELINLLWFGSGGKLLVRFGFIRSVVGLCLFLFGIALLHGGCFLPRMRLGGRETRLRRRCTPHGNYKHSI